jgi:predicted ATPase
MTRLRAILSKYKGKPVKTVKETLAEEYERSKKEDNVNHPSHYTQGAIECIDAIKEATKGLLGIEAVCTANIIKYVWRWKFKNGVEDLRKARWYLDRLIEEVSTTKN